MKTGEGKTLVATLPVYLNALSGKGVHVVTVNDYLARRDAQWMSPVYTFLGLTVGVIVHGLTDEQRKEAYGSDITYGTNNEFGFDYLRDNMKFELDEYVQRELNYAIVDEVDSILIDEARTPLIISGPTEESTDKYYKINRIIPSLKKDEDYTIEEKTKTAALTEEGNVKVEKMLGAGNLYDPANVDLVHHVHQALKAHALFHRDVDYVVKDGEVMIVDEFTGRLDAGQALERRPAPGHRGQGRRQDREREPDAGLDHLPELFPPVQEARGHDRHGGDRGGGVRQDLQSRRRRDPHAPSDDPRGQRRRHLQEREGKVQRGH